MVKVAKQAAPATTANTKAAAATKAAAKPATGAAKKAATAGKAAAGKDVKKAKLAATAALKRRFLEKPKKIRTSAKFRRPKTLHQARAPRYPRTSGNSEAKKAPASVIIAPVTSDAAMKRTEHENTLVLLVNLRANKPIIKTAVKNFFGVDVEKVRTLITPRGQKKAYVRLVADADAMDVATRVGMV